MNILVAGSRSFNNYILMYKLLKRELALGDTIISGMARGVDTLAYWYSLWNSHLCIEKPADWETYGKQAGMIRNAEMVNISDRVIVIWDGKSKGTNHTIAYSLQCKKPLAVYRYSDDDLIPLSDNVVHCKREKFDVYIGRGQNSVFYNPYKLEDEKDRFFIVCKFADYLMKNKHILNHVPELENKILGCWCRHPNEKRFCHGDVLAWLATHFTKELTMD